MIADALKVACPTLQEVAERAGVTTAAIYAYSRGRRTPDAETMRTLAFVLRQQAGELFTMAAQLDAEAGRQDE